VARAKATGVPLQNVNPALAIPACQSAVQRYPNSSPADQGNANAQANLGVMYEDGRGVPHNYATAMLMKPTVIK
jgi:TPR repeat protein